MATKNRRTKNRRTKKRAGMHCCGRRRNRSPQRKRRTVKDQGVKGLNNDDDQNEMDSFLSGIMSDSDDEDNTTTENPVASKKKNKTKKRKTKKRKTKKRKLRKEIKKGD